MVSTSSVQEGCWLMLACSSFPWVFRSSALVRVLYVEALKVSFESEYVLVKNSPCLDSCCVSFAIVNLSCWDIAIDFVCFVFQSLCWCCCVVTVELFVLVIILEFIRIHT